MSIQPMLHLSRLSLNGIASVVWRRARGCARPIVTLSSAAATYEQLALALGRPSAEAARLEVRRALLRLANEMTHA